MGVALPLLMLRRVVWSGLVGLCLLVAGCPSDSDQPCGPSTTVPTPRVGAVAGWDRARGRLVSFGGDQGAVVDCAPQSDFINQTVAWDGACGGFVGVGGATLPFARGGHAGAVDANGQTLFMHGGRHRAAGQGGSYAVFGDLWALDFAADRWEELDPSGDPPGRFDHVLVASPSGPILHGGNRASGADVDALDDVWRFDLLTGLWARIEATGGPGPRHQHAAAAGESGVWLFGGEGTAGAALADLWRLTVDPPAYTQLHSGSGGPARRVGAALILDSANNRLLLFGGRDDGPLGFVNDLWGFDLAANAWTELSAGDSAGATSGSACVRPAGAVDEDLTAPERRAGASVALGSGGALMVFGGRTECGPIDDVWSWSSGLWTRLREASAGRSCLRAGAECSTICP